LNLKLAKFINPKSSDSKLKQLITLLICLFSLASIAQVVPKRIIYATYYQQDGEPGRTIDKGNGTEVHLMPVTHSETFLKIKRCGRAKHTTVIKCFSLRFDNYNSPNSMVNKSFSPMIRVFHGRTAPEPATLAGYGSIIHTLEMPIPMPDVLSLISTKKRKYTVERWQVFTPRHQPKNLVFVGMGK
jgi:hypothetical protein